jgi:cell wall-associated NlpC family hydrolase
VRDSIVAEARTWLDTPYLHQGRRKGHGVDCLGLVIGVGKALGLLDYDHRAYSPQPDADLLCGECERYLVRREGLAPGAIALMWIAHRELPQHMAIVTELAAGRTGIIHAHQRLGRVREHGLDAFWGKRVLAVYDFAGAG